MTQPQEQGPAASIRAPATRRGEAALRFLPLLITAFTTVMLIAAGAGISGALAIGLVCGLALIIVRYPLPGYYLLLSLALLADYAQWNFSAWTHTLGFYVFENWWKLLSPTDVREFGWLVCNTVDVLIVAVFLGWAGHARRNTGRFELTPEALLTLVYAAVFGIMFTYGLLSGGNVKAALWQIRPYFHFAAIALLGIQLLRTREHIRTLTWIIAVVVCIKSVQIIWLFLIDAGGSFGEWREILGHEDSIFIAGIIGLVAAFLLYRSGDTQKVLLLLALPVLFIALVLNLRRAGYVALAFIFMLMPLVLHGRRKIAVQLALLFAVAGIAYTMLFWDATGLIGMPAQKVKSILFASTATADHLSNLYRLAENVNLRRTIIANPFGIGFGHPFEMYVPLADISFLLPNWQYHPHNMILGMWMTLGTPGFALFLFYHAGILMLAGRYMRHLNDNYLRAACFFALSTYASGFLVASVDQFIWSERGAIFMGLLIAMLSSLGRLSDQKQTA